MTNNDEQLSQTAARLSISTDDKSVIKQVRDFLADQSPKRRDSAVSITSIDEEPKHNGVIEPPNGNREVSENVSSKHRKKARRRRRSSAQSSSEPRAEKVHKKKLKRDNEPVSIVYDESCGKALAMAQFRTLLHSIVLGTPAQGQRLVKVNKPTKVTKVVFAFVPGLRPSDFNVVKSSEEPLLQPMVKEKETKMAFFYNVFDYLMPLTISGSKDSIYLCSQTLINFGLSKKEKKQRAEELRQTKLVLYDLLLTRDQMEKSNYPIHSLQSGEESVEEGWVETTNFEHDGSHTFALDCEFCESLSGKVLTRISIVNFQGETVYDTYVKPKEEITDYVTRYSGITEEILKGVTTTLADVQAKVLDTVSSSDILIGHSLDSDLRVLKVKHPRVIDTAIIYDHHRGPPSKPGLKWLSATFLSRSIQQGEQTGAGHSSVEDLLACLDLVKMKLVEGPEFGRVPREVTLFEKLREEKVDKLSTIIDHSPALWGPYIWEQPNLRVLSVSDDDEVAEEAVDAVKDSDLLLLRFKEIDYNSGAVAVPSLFKGKLYSELDNTRHAKATLTEENRLELLDRLNERLQKVFDSLPSDSVFIVASEGSDSREMMNLQRVRRNFQNLERSGADLSSLLPEECWDFDKLSALHRATTEARKGIAFVGRKE